MLLGAMKVLTEMKDELCGTVLFCYEEGEEPNSGIQALLAALEKYNVDYCWGHPNVYAELEEGKISVDAGPVWRVPALWMLYSAARAATPAVLTWRPTPSLPVPAT